MEPWMRRLEKMRAAVVEQKRREALLRNMEELLERHFKKKETMWQNQENRVRDEIQDGEQEKKTEEGLKTKSQNTEGETEIANPSNKSVAEDSKEISDEDHPRTAEEKQGKKEKREAENGAMGKKNQVARVEPPPLAESPDSGAPATVLPEPEPPDTGQLATVLPQPESSFAVTLATTTGSLLAEPKGTDTTEPQADDSVDSPPPSEQPEQPTKGRNMGFEEEKGRSIEQIRSWVASASLPEPPDAGTAAAIPPLLESPAAGQLATASGSPLTSSKGRHFTTEEHAIHFEKKDRGAKQVICNLGIILNLMGEAQSYNSPRRIQKARMSTTATSNVPLNNDISFFNCDSSAVGHVSQARKVDFIIDGLQNIEILILPVGHAIGSCLSIEMFKTGRCNFQKIFEQQLLQLLGITPSGVVLENAKEKLERSCKGIECLLGDVTCDYDTLDYHETVDQHSGPLFLCYESLQSCGFGVLADGSLAELIHRAAIFGMMLIKLDMQQEFGRYVETLDAMIKLDMGNYSEWEEEIFACVPGTSYFKKWDPGGLSFSAAVGEGRLERHMVVGIKAVAILGFLPKSNTQNRVFDPGEISSVSGITWSIYLSQGILVEVIFSVVHFFHLEDKVNFKGGVLLGHH